MDTCGRIDPVTGTRRLIGVGGALQLPRGITALQSGLLAVGSSVYPSTGGSTSMIVLVDPSLPFDRSADASHEPLVRLQPVDDDSAPLST